MTEIVQAISVCGFPIVCAAACGWFFKYSYDKSREDNKNAMEKIGSLAEAVNNNTHVLTMLVEKLDKEGEEDGK